MEQFKKLCAPPFTAALFTLAKSEAAQAFLTRWTDKEEGVCMCDAHSALGCHSAIKEMDLAICNNMDGPRGYYVKWN